MQTANMTTDEIVQLAAIDSRFYRHHFFPKAFRQDSPDFHDDIWTIMEDPSARYCAAKVFRDGAKTTNLRGYLSKRIAYAVSRTILIIGKSEKAACKTIDWIRRAVEHNHVWAQTFGLSKGKQWSESEIDIVHSVQGCNIRCIAMGITGSTRGINVDDYRPDLILVDDPCDEENTGTPEQRLKVENLFFGAIKNCLAPATDMPEAKMVLLQTPLDSEDLIEKAMLDPQWRTISFSCFDENGESTWPSRYPTAELLEEKEAAIRRGQLHLWMREKEVTVTSDAAKAFKLEWLDYWDVLPEGGVNYLGIDPTPPPKEGGPSSNKIAKLDDAVIYAIKLYKGKVYSLEYYTCKSPNPAEFVNKIFEFVVRWKPRRVGVETTLFQRMLKWYVEEEMTKRQHFFQILPIEDKRKKETRILQTLSGRASTRNIVVHRSHTGFIEQFGKFPLIPHDDIIDAFTIAVMCINPALEMLDDAIDGEWEVLDDMPELPDWRAAP